MDITLNIWRQENPDVTGGLKTYTVADVDPDMQFLYMLDLLNFSLIKAGERPVAFNHGCREGICGYCGFMINGVPNGHRDKTAVCQLYVREFIHEPVLVLEPFRSRALPVIRDLLVDRGALERMAQTGGLARDGTAGAGAADANGKGPAEALYFCLDCGACVAACPNGSAMLMTAAKLSPLASLHSSRPQRSALAVQMVERMDGEGFGACSDHRECEAVCPKGIPASLIAAVNSNYLAVAVDRIKKVFLPRSERGE